MASSKINRNIRSKQNIGFGTQPGNIGGRFVNRDGTFNLRKTGWPIWKRMSIYSFLHELTWLQFLLTITVFYILVNLFFTSLYILAGLENFQGFLSTTRWGQIRETFFFSTQTFTTVGYGRINPAGDLTDAIASVEAMCGWLFFALVTGITYGRFTQPRAFIAFSSHLLVSPFKEGLALMFRMVPYKTVHQLAEARVTVNISLLVTENEKRDYQFYQLNLERSHIEMFNMNWTVVHPIDEESPLYHFSKDDLEASDFELMVQVSGFDPLYANHVMQRTSYTFEEVVWGGRFSSMYHQSEDGNTTILELDKLSHYQPIALPEMRRQK